MHIFIKLFVSAVLISNVIAFFFISKFTEETYGWFRPSPNDVVVTLIFLLVASVVFTYYESRFKGTSIFCIFLPLIFFVAYFGFVFIPISDWGPEGFMLGLLYGIGKYGSYFLGALFLLKIIKRKLVGYE